MIGLEIELKTIVSKFSTKERMKVIEIIVTPRERKFGWAISEKIPAWLYSIKGLVAAY